MTETTVTPDPDDTPVECPECHGSGYRDVYSTDDGTWWSVPCHECGGKGKVSPMLAGILKRRGV